jgi:hypothetical protein
VDGVVLDYAGNPTPGIQQLCDVLGCLGYELRVWSAGGAEYALAAAHKAGIYGACRQFFDKPEYPQTLETARQALGLTGQRVVLQIDDDPGERVPTWPFYVVAQRGPAARIAAADRLAEAVRTVIRLYEPEAGVDPRGVPAWQAELHAARHERDAALDAYDAAALPEGEEDH